MPEIQIVSLGGLFKLTIQTYGRPASCAGDAASRTKSVQSTECTIVNRQLVLDQSRIVVKEILVTARAGVWKRKREDLKSRRIPLFKRYEKSPHDLRLALEIRIIDDQIAQCTYQIEHEARKLELV